MVSVQSIARVEQTVDVQTQLKSWKLTEAPFSLELIQRLPDQTRAFFQGRGFSSDIANDIATQCVLQTIGKNTSRSPQSKSISYNLYDWKIYVTTKAQRIKFKETWDKEWAEDGVSTASRIAFRWATFPTQQSFDPGGDFNWGMISFGLPPGSKFDLKVVWKHNNKTHSQWIKQIECPADQ
ncbi:MAG: hypothetical protein GY744_06350 [Gammaproteobacteria bacterium]|nr:hypothetical protein [Gammaproteobacteria bacterium]